MMLLYNNIMVAFLIVALLILGVSGESQEKYKLKQELYCPGADGSSGGCTASAVNKNLTKMVSIGKNKEIHFF